MNYLQSKTHFCNHKNLSNASTQTAIRAELIGSNTCTAAGITVVDHAPVLALCRALITASQDPNRPLRAYRGDALVCECAVSAKALSSPSRMTGEVGRGSGAGEIGHKGVAQPRRPRYRRVYRLQPNPNVK